MKTMNEKAIDYCLEKKGQIHQEFIDDFEAGYKAALEWISVDDELPANETYINLKFKNGDIGSVFFETNTDKKYIKRYCTHWRPIN